MSLQFVVCLLWSACTAVEVLTTGAGWPEFFAGALFMPACCAALNWITTRPS